MKRVDHPSVVAARRELLAHGYWPMWAPVGKAQKWRRLKEKKPELVIRQEQRPRSVVWHIEHADGGAEQLALLEEQAA